ncbi:MAG: T9SS type A sorting domain-containing protein [Muribaculaceae bacterium]|nr:T9SS type A sorting domain-containing protein [Muribaculaceae bacterium]
MKAKYKVILIATMLAISGKMYSENLLIGNKSNTIVGNVSEHTFMNDKCAVEFNIDVTHQGSYYACFWVHPLRYDINEYASYAVYVNNTLVGNIAPTTPGWQAIGLSDDSVISLSEGNNSIVIVGDESAVPMVDMVQFGLDYASAQILQSDTIEQIANIAETNDVIISDGMEGSISMPLSYSYNQQIMVKPNEEIEVETYDALSHSVDILFSDRRGNWSSTPEMNQHLNWYKESEAYSSQSSDHKAYLRVKSMTPGQAFYTIKLRGGESGVKQSVDILRINIIDTLGNVRNTYLAEDCSAFYAHADGVLLSGNSYVSKVRCAGTMGNLTPDLAITGAGSTPGRIIKLGSLLDLTSMYFEVETTPIISTTGFHVYNSSSMSPDGHCYVKLIYNNSNAQYVSQVKKGNDNTSVISAQCQDLNILKSKESVTIIGATGKVDVAIYMFDGVKVAEASGSESVSLSTAELPIGIYVVKATDSTGNKLIQKIVIK